MDRPAGIMDGRLEHLQIDIQMSEGLLLRFGPPRAAPPNPGARRRPRRDSPDRVSRDPRLSRSGCRPALRALHPEATEKVARGPHVRPLRPRGSRRVHRPRSRGALERPPDVHQARVLQGDADLRPARADILTLSASTRTECRRSSRRTFRRSHSIPPRGPRPQARARGRLQEAQRSVAHAQHP